jgi:nitrogen fixation NifU-like protein
MEWLSQIAAGSGLLAALVTLWVLVDRVVNPTAAHVDEPDTEARLTGACGDTMEMKLKLRDGIVTAASYWTDGCGPSSACAAAATRLSIGKSVDEVPEAVAPEAVARAVGGLPEDQRHCAALASETLFEAIHRHLLQQNRAPLHDDAKSHH